MNKNKLIGLINKAKNKEIVMICGDFIYYVDENETENEIDLHDKDYLEIKEIIKDEDAFDVFEDNMHTYIKLK